MTKQNLILETVSVFEGRYPDVALSEGIQVDALTENDPNPMFVTVPIARVGAESRNTNAAGKRRRYNREAVMAIVDAINKERVTGGLGHLRDEDRPYQFDVPPMRWVGATMEGDTAWGKAYVLPSRNDVREYIRTAKATNGRIGTSLYALGSVDDDGNVTIAQLESIDLVHPDRVGVQAASAKPTITRESHMEHKPTMDSAAPVQAVAENAALRAAQERVRELTITIQEQETALRDRKTLAELLGEPEDVVLALRALIADRDSLRRENGELLEASIQLAVAEACKPEAPRGIIVEMVRQRKPVTRTDVKVALDAVIGKPEVQAIIKAAVVETMGPAQPAVSEGSMTDKKPSTPLFFMG